MFLCATTGTGSIDIVVRGSKRGVFSCGEDSAPDIRTVDVAMVVLARERMTGVPARMSSMRRECLRASDRKRCAPISSLSGVSWIRSSEGFSEICHTSARGATEKNTRNRLPQEELCSIQREAVHARRGDWVQKQAKLITKKWATVRNGRLY